MEMAKIVGLIGLLTLLAGCATTPMAIPVRVVETVEVEVEVPVPVTTTVPGPTHYVNVPGPTVFQPVTPTLRMFESGDVLRDYLLTQPVLMPAEGQDCDDLARFFMLNAMQKGYLVSMQYLPDWRGKGPHMLNMVLTQNNSIYYVEPSTNEYWWVSPID